MAGGYSYAGQSGVTRNKINPLTRPLLPHGYR